MRRCDSVDLDLSIPFHYVGSFKSKAGKGLLMQMAARGMALRMTHEFRQADG